MEHALPPPEGTITTERRAGLLLVGINRPAKRNGFTPRMFRELAQAYTLLDDDPDLGIEPNGPGWATRCCTCSPATSSARRKRCA